jgi:hypothetical protein
MTIHIKLFEILVPGLRGCEERRRFEAEGSPSDWSTLEKAWPRASVANTPYPGLANRNPALIDWSRDLYIRINDSYYRLLE